ncbi:MAG: hypothetical protein KAW88_05950 [Candidatus Cloacimonetes bacterium]|nr:hypothetical protein [Candidatus Cloacimonadota bacterium]
MSEICSIIGCNYEVFEKGKCIFHCKKDDWYDEDNNGKKDWSNSKGKIQKFWELFIHELKKDEELHEFADIKFPISFIYDSFSEFKLELQSEMINDGKSLKLYNCTFLDKVEIESTNFFNSLSFSECKFKNNFIIDGDVENLDFCNCNFDKELKLVSLENANLYIEGGNFKDRIYSWLCSFKELRVKARNITDFKFFKCKMYSKMVFKEVYVDRLSFKKCKFDDDLYCEFHDVNISSLDIDSVDNISDAVVFFDVTIHRQFLLKNTNLSNYEFHNCDVSECDKIKIKNVAFQGNNGFTIFNDVKWPSCKKFSYLNDKDKNKDKTKDETKKEDKDKKKSLTLRDTFRQLKYVNEKQGNIIEANKFYSAEMNAYKEEIKGEKWKTHWQDKIIFWLNEKVSNFSQNWLRPLGWFFLLGFIAFVFSNVNRITTYLNNTSKLTPATFLNAINEFFVYLNPFNTSSGKWNPVIWLVFKALSIFIIYQFIISLRRQTRR